MNGLDCRFSIIVLVYNGIPIISECLELFFYTFQYWELIVSDNCSTYGTRNNLNNIKDEKDFFSGGRLKCY